MKLAELAADQCPRPLLAGALSTGWQLGRRRRLLVRASSVSARGQKGRVLTADALHARGTSSQDGGRVPKRAAAFSV